MHTAHPTYPTPARLRPAPVSPPVDRHAPALAAALAIRLVLSHWPPLLLQIAHLSPGSAASTRQPNADAANDRLGRSCGTPFVHFGSPQAKRQQIIRSHTAMPRVR